MFQIDHAVHSVREHDKKMHRRLWCLAPSHGFRCRSATRVSARHIRRVFGPYGDFRLDLQNVAFSGDYLVQYGIDEESDEEAGDETGHDDNSEGSLSIRSDAGGKGRWQ
jgi:hypothetical protein